VILNSIFHNTIVLKEPGYFSPINPPKHKADNMIDAAPSPSTPTRAYTIQWMYSLSSLVRWLSGATIHSVYILPGSAGYTTSGQASTCNTRHTDITVPCRLKLIHHYRHYCTLLVEEYKSSLPRNQVLPL